MASKVVIKMHTYFIELTSPFNKLSYFLFCLAKKCSCFVAIMKSSLQVYNTLSRKKEAFVPSNPPSVGMYVCGPTVYGPPHLGHARGAITFDTIYRYLLHLGYRVRYVRNITDVGHLEGDADVGEDKIAKKARLEKLEPMEIAMQYTRMYHTYMDKLQVLRPSIEPLATGHIPEQIELVEQIIASGYGYESKGSVYFDVLKYAQSYHYGELSGRVLDELLQTTRELDGQAEKKNSADFALWKKASPEHLMQWRSPWSTGFPGWHLECSAMSKKYLGETFDIHGGGMDLVFPHHEAEIAQCRAGVGAQPAKYWIHNNMITINGQKMGKSLGNFITLEQLMDGSHSALEQAYTPMTIRFFMLQAHYRSTLDFSNASLKAASKAYAKITNAWFTLNKLTVAATSPSAECALDKEILGAIEHAHHAMCDDFNTAEVISALFKLAEIINKLDNHQYTVEMLSPNGLESMKVAFQQLYFDILGLTPEIDLHTFSTLDQLLEIYKIAKQERDYAKVDVIRNILKQSGLSVLDKKDGTVTWNLTR